MLRVGRLNSKIKSLFLCERLTDDGLADDDPGSGKVENTGIFLGSDLNGDCCRLSGCAERNGTGAGDIRLDCLNESKFAELSTGNRRIWRRCLPWTAAAANETETG